MAGSQCATTWRAKIAEPRGKQEAKKRRKGGGFNMSNRHRFGGDAAAFTTILRCDGGVPVPRHIKMSRPLPNECMARFSTASYSRRHNHDEIPIQRKRKRTHLTTVSTTALIFSTTLCFSTPNFDYRSPPTGAMSPFSLDSTALALEPLKGEGESSTTWPSTSSAMSDQLLKSMINRESYRIPSSKLKYWESMEGTADDIMFANEKLIDHAVSTISTMYYDTSGGFNFDAQDFYAKWKKFRYTAHQSSGNGEKKKTTTTDEFYSLVENGFATRDDAVKTLKSIVSSLHDPYSKYLTREELRMELQGGSDGFLGLGLLVDVTDSPSGMNYDRNMANKHVSSSVNDFDRVSSRPLQGGVSFLHSFSYHQQFAFLPLSRNTPGKSSSILSVTQAVNLPIVTAIIPDSPAERAGLVVGDRIASVGGFKFIGLSQGQVKSALKQRFNGENYFGRVELTIAKQVFANSPFELDNGNDNSDKYVFEDGWYQRREKISDFVPRQQVIGYKLSHVKSIPTTLTIKSDGPVSPITALLLQTTKQNNFPKIAGGDTIVHYELLTPVGSIFMADKGGSRPVGYIRLTRFSAASTAGYINAIKNLEEGGAQSYIIDLRNNYGGVIQEAMVTASSLLRDPHSVLCYTLNSRGGFKPQENMEYIVDLKYPGYLLSSESSAISRDQVRKEHPEYLVDGGWSSPTSYASLKELRMTRGIKPSQHSSSIIRTEGNNIERRISFLEMNKIDVDKLTDMAAKKRQKKVVILINEGTGKPTELCIITLVAYICVNSLSDMNTLSLIMFVLSIRSRSICQLPPR